MTLKTNDAIQLLHKAGASTHQLSSVLLALSDGNTKGFRKIGTFPVGDVIKAILSKDIGSLKC